MESATLWMGDIEEDMDEDYVKDAFKNVGYTVISVREIFSKDTGQRATYCFVDFGGVDIAREVLIKVNGEPIPGGKERKFKLNRAEYGRSKGGNIEYSLFVADLTAEVTDDMLLILSSRDFIWSILEYFAPFNENTDFFRPKYSSVRAAKVVKDTRGISKGFGFVRFFDEDQFKQALNEMNGVKGLGKRPIKVNVALKRKEPSFNAPQEKEVSLGPLSEYPAWMQMQMNYMQQMHQYMQQCQLYAQQAANYAAWQGQQQPQPERPPKQEEPQEDAPAVLMNYVQKQHEELLAKSAEMEDEVDLVDPNPPVDIDAMNREIIERDDKLFFELEASRWDFENAVKNAIKQLPI